MKFFSVAFVAVLLCAAVYADEPPYNSVQFRELIKCVDGVFTELMGKYSELEKHHPEYQALAEKTNLKLDECDKAENDDAKNECLSEAAEDYFSFFEALRFKLQENKDNEKLIAELGFLLMTKCPR